MTTLVPYALTTLQKVRDYLQIATADTTKDTLIGELINQATDFIENYCGARRFLATSYVSIRDSRKGHNVFLEQLPVRTLTTVEYRSGTPSTPIWNTYNVDSYILYAKEGYVHFYGMLPDVPQGLRFTYNAGYLIDFTQETITTAHTLPFDLTQVCTQLVARAVNQAASAGIVEMSTEGQSVQFDNKMRSMTDIQLAVLDKYADIRYAM